MMPSQIGMEISGIVHHELQGKKKFLVGRNLKRIPTLTLGVAKYIIFLGSVLI